MGFVQEDRDGEVFLRIDGDFTAYEVHKYREVLLAALESGSGLLLDLNGVTDCDTAGIQLLFSAHKTASDQEKRLVLTAASDVVREMSDRLGINIRNIMHFQE